MDFWIEMNLFRLRAVVVNPDVICLNNRSLVLKLNFNPPSLLPDILTMANRFEPKMSITGSHEAFMRINV